MSDTEKKRLAVMEKEKGNEVGFVGVVESHTTAHVYVVCMQAFRSRDYEEALSYYSRSILLDSSAPSYNNRAIALIKLKRYRQAIQDCKQVLQLEPTNTKGVFLDVTFGCCVVHSISLICL